MRKYLVVYEKSKTGFSAYVPDAINFHLKGLKEEKLRIPKASAESKVIIITVD